MLAKLFTSNIQVVLSRDESPVSAKYQLCNSDSEWGIILSFDYRRGGRQKTFCCNQIQGRFPVVSQPIIIASVCNCRLFILSPDTSEKVSEQDLRFSLLCMLVEISTNLHKVSQCLEKAPTSAFSLLNAQTIAFTTIKNLCWHYAKRTYEQFKHDM